MDTKNDRIIEKSETAAPSKKQGKKLPNKAKIAIIIGTPTLVVTVFIFLLLLGVFHTHAWRDYCTYTICEKCGEKHEYYEVNYRHEYDTISIIGSCSTELTEECVCKICGEKEYKRIRYLDDHLFDNWQIINEATCTSEGTKERQCIYCNEKETMAIAMHNYVDGVCSNCHRGIIDIKFPEMPITVHKYASDGSIISSCQILSISISSVSIYTNINECSIEILWSGEKTYDEKGDSYSRAVGFGYKLYDSEGYVIDSGSDSSSAIIVGEKFKNEKLIIFLDDIDPNEVLSMEIFNLK